MSDELIQKLLVKIVTVDYYLSKPIPQLKDPCYSGFRSSSISYVPVIRVFGPTSNGVKTCVHIHGVFPYMFVPNWNFSVHKKDLYQFAILLDKAINASFAHSNSKTCHVYRITAVLGRPFYGFHEVEKQFLKIEFFNPAVVKRAAELLQNEAVFNTSFQPYEAHVPFILQFFIDNNLYGMNYISISSYSHRSSNDDAGADLSQHDTSKKSYCALEIDTSVENLVNLHQNMDNMTNNPGLAFIWEEEKRRRRLHNEPSQITLTLSQYRPVKTLTRTESYFQNRMADKLNSHKNLCPTPIDSCIEPSQSSESENAELNSQSRSVLSLLEKLVQEKEENELSTSASSSPSVVYSDNEGDGHVESSQPILKLRAENDSILGDNFSDNETDEIDDIDHFELSQSIGRSHLEELLSGDESDAGICNTIPQLDGATSPDLFRRSVSKKPSRSRRTYNLRSKNTHFATTEVSRCSRTRVADSKPSPRKQYPQLQIDTQKSPKCVAHRRTSPPSQSRKCSIPGTPPSTSSQSLGVDSCLNLADDCMRNDFKRPYPQLRINVKKSPKTFISEEKREPPSRLRKRKINFSDQSTLSNNSSIDMNSATVKWKKQRLNQSGRIDDEYDARYTIGSDINSQKYSLKIRFNADELSEKLYADMLPRNPIVKLKRISLDGVTTIEKSEQHTVAFERHDLKVDKLACSSDSPVLKSELENFALATSKEQMSSDELAQKFVRRKRLGMRMDIPNIKDRTREYTVSCSALPLSESKKIDVTDNKASQSHSVDTNEFLMGVSKPVEHSVNSWDKGKGICDSSPSNLESFISAMDVTLSGIDQTEINPAEQHQKNMESSVAEMADLNKIFEFGEKPGKSKKAVSRKHCLRNFQEKTEKSNASRHRLKGGKIADSDKNLKFNFSKSVDVKLYFNDDEKTADEIVESDSNIDDLKRIKSMQQIKNFEMNPEAVDIDDSTSNNELIICSKMSENNSNAKMSKVFKNDEHSKSAITSSSSESFHRDKPCFSDDYDDDFIVLSADTLTDSTDQNKNKLFSNYQDELVDNCKPYFGRENVIMQIDSEENGLNIASSKNVSDSCVKSGSEGIVEFNEASVTNVSRTLNDEEIEKIALSIFNQTLNATNTTLNFSEIHDVADVSEVKCSNSSTRSRELAIENVSECARRSTNQSDVVYQSTFDRSKHSVTDADEVVFSDEVARIPADNAESIVSNKKISRPTANINRSVIDEIIHFAELDSDESLVNPEEPKNTTKSNKSLCVGVNNFPSTCASEFFTNGSLMVNVSNVKSPESEELRRIIAIKDHVDKSEQLHQDSIADFSSHISCQNSPNVFNSKKPARAESRKQHIHFKRSIRSVKALRWADDEFNESSNLPLRIKNEDLVNTSTQHTALYSVSIFANTADKPNEFELPASNLRSTPDSVEILSAHRAKTPKLFSSLLPPINEVLNTFKANTKSQLSNEDDGIVEIYSSSSSESNKNRTDFFTEDDCRFSTTVDASTGSFDTLPASKVDYKFDNSIWYSSDEESDENRVCSLYKDESVSSPEMTLFADNLVRNNSFRRVDEVIQSNEDEKSSSQETNHSGSEILLLGSQSPRTVSQNNKSIVSDDSPTTFERNRRIPHSTPTGRRTKKSPSPNYTPIYKRLMLKVMSEEEKHHIGRAELSLENIPEEAETRVSDTSFTLMNNSVAKSTAGCENKSPDASRAVNSVGSGRIDVTMNDTYGFKIGLENLQDVKADVQFQFITVMSMELFVETRLDLNPDPEYDPISCIFYNVFHDAPNTPELTAGMIIVNAESSKLDLQKFSCHKQYVKNENDLFDSFVNIIRQHDPDMFLGYEIEMLSWGYLIQRGQHKNRNCCVELSRIIETRTKEFKDKSFLEDGDYSNELKLVGRIVLNVWRLMRHEIALQSYSFENILFHIMHQRAPRYSHRTLTQWWRSSSKRWMVIDYYLFRVENNILMLQQRDFFGRTSELAKLFGIQFYEVLSRGSQFRVESMMLRLAKTQNFVAMSPNPKQRASMRAPESLPLIMEPESKYYKEPVIVLDFQSLYPSIIIAYNYCFSTCLGRVQHLINNETFEFGCAQHTVPIDLLLRLESSINYSPCGVAFVNKNVRKGILPAMLEEILETRLMVKKSMKQNKSNSILQRVLHARQLGLKLIANVTYGYTSANFSGRMPCIEIGDSVVSKGRETLERAIELISANEKWRAKVIYGDTDSLFVIVPGRNKDEAFRIGSEIVDAVTNDNPKPVKLKLEKVYYPCILQTKKRYVGYMYESADQKEPVYDAKGIETVRRDGCPAVAKILEKSIKLLFETDDVATVKCYVQRQFSKVISGRLSLQELTFAREYRGMNNYKPAACVPALQLAKQALLRDRRSEPRVKERVRYVLTAGPPNVPLIRLIRTPEQFLGSPGSSINAEYYITRAIIPALERCFALMNVNVQDWYVELPRKKQFLLPVQNDLQGRRQKKKTIFQYFASSKCISCGGLTTRSVCKQCEQKPQQLAVIFGNFINTWQRKQNYISKICRSCSGCIDTIECVSLDCPVYYARRQAVRDVEQVPFVEELQQKYLRLNLKQAAK